MSRHVLIVAGDPSADRHGMALVRALKDREPGLRVTALGGEHLRSVADTFAYPLVGIGGFGFWEPLLKLPQLWKARQAVRQCLTEDRPDAVIPMDYYGFNIHVARMAKAAGLPVIYYISPQVWASRPGRIQELKQTVDEMLLILPFEKPLYEKAGVAARFVGHPLMEILPLPTTPPARRIIGLLPGSRRGVIRRHLPVLCRTAALLKSQFPDADFLLFRPSEIESSFYSKALAEAPYIQLVTDGDYRLRGSLTLAISVSGTAALENTLLGIPMIIMYKLSPLTYEIARRLIRISYVGMPNILANRSIVPELLQSDATPERLSESAAQWLRDPRQLERTREILLGLRAQLAGGASLAAADAILERLGSRRPSRVEHQVAS